LFTEIKLIGTPLSKPLPLATRLGTQIDNEPGPPISEEAVKKHEQLVRKHGRWWQRRVDPVGGYNCAGHVWASRRAAVYESSEWRKIIAEDGYKPVRETVPIPGDLAIYLLPDGKIVHIGEVMRIEGGAGEIKKAFVLSKWDDLSGEYLHNVDDVPFKHQFPDMKVEFWTERLREPNAPGEN
jgi:hypothetical protein